MPRTAAYPDLTRELCLSIGDELHPTRLGPPEWADLAADLRLQPTRFDRARNGLVARVVEAAKELREGARERGWHDRVVDDVLAVIEERAPSAAA